MTDFFSHFHLLRPFWLLAFIPALLLFVLLLKQRLTSARWQGIIDPNLMPHVLDQMPTEQSRWPLWFVLMAWLIACIALAGPTWQQLPQPVQKKEDSLVIVLDMSLSMAAQDVSPDRTTRARQKVIDILKQRNEGLTAMVVYAGDAYTVTPLTDDSDTIINLVPALSPFIMPAMGSRPDKALALAKKLITDAGLMKANYLLITDGILKKDIQRIKKALGSQAKQLSVLTIGTEEGAPIAMQGQGFKRDKNGNIVLPKLDLDLISELASELDIPWHQMSFDDRDWHYLLQDELLQNDKKHTYSANNQAPLERQFDLWADQGYWLILVLIVLASFYFRRGWMLSLIFAISLQPDTSFANEVNAAQSGYWKNAWTTKDQQGQALFEQAPKQAAELFEDENWKAASHYRAQDYQAAAEYFTSNPDDSEQKQANSHYNRGNALAHAGDLEQAIKAYQQALELTPDFEDASFNKQLVEELLKQQQSESNQDDSQKENSEQENSDQEDSQKEDSQQQDSKQQNSEDQQSEEQNSQHDESQSQDSEKQESEKQNTEEKSAEEQDSERQEHKEQKLEQQNSQEQEEGAQQQSTQPDEDDLSREEKQALKQWLNRIPDDPGGLLKRKFLYQYKQREHQDEGEVSW